MLDPDRLDYSELSRTAGRAALLNTLSRSPLIVMAAVVSVLLVSVPTTIAVVLVGTGNATDVGGLVVLAMCAVGGGYVVWQVVMTAYRDDAFDRFAASNGLRLTTSSLAPDYAGRPFASGRAAVDRSARTPDAAFVEIGNSFAVETRVDRRRRERSMFLRARLAGGARRAGEPALPPGVTEALRRLTGDHAVELTADELTVLGTRPLQLDDRGHLHEAFAIITTLAEANARQRAASIMTGPRPVPAGRSPRGLARVVGVTLLLLAVGPVLIALAMSGIDELLRGRQVVASVLVTGITVVALVVTAWVGRRLLGSTSRRD